MNIAVVYGQQHRGNTWKLSQLFLDHFRDESNTISEIYLPKEAPDYCIGCINCFMKGEETCPEADVVQPIVAKLDAADVIVIATPTYVMGMSAQTKSLFDHLGYRYMAHRPFAGNFTKQAVIFTTAAGLGASKAANAVADNFRHWGVARIYKIPVSLRVADYDAIPKARLARIERKVAGIANRVKRNHGAVTTGIKQRVIFSFMRMGQLNNDWNPVDKSHWESQGWLAKARPWN